MTEKRPFDFDRRSFLKQSVVGAFGVGGATSSLTGGVRAQDGGGQGGDTDEEDQDGSFYGRRMVLQYPDRLGGNVRQKLIIMTDRKDRTPDQIQGINEEAVAQCNFGDEWPPENLNIWEGILVDWKNAGRTVGFYGRNPTVRATQLVERDTIFVDAQPSDIPLGTPFVISRTNRCPDGLLGVEAIKVPGIDVKTGPGVSTDDGAGDN
ncbi:hypothetical protein [Halorussus salinus]|uniref:hypothetical protein n=1 Tax=Halorussus salinus TaxID=1364935 RepID=UPI001092A621|nr:hypothetical protein [Halorussus salinus]